MLADSIFLGVFFAENFIFCGTARPLSLEKKLSRATRGTAHLAPFLQVPDSTFLGMFFAENIMFYNIFGVPEVESAVLIPGCRRRATDSTFSDRFFAENIMFL